MTYRMLSIPYDPDSPLRLSQEEESHLVPLVFQRHFPERDELAISTFSTHGVQIAYDDLGMFRQGARDMRNERAERIWAGLAMPRLGAKFAPLAQPLVGNFVALGFAPDGATADLPADVINWIQQLGLLERPKGR